MVRCQTRIDTSGALAGNHISSCNGLSGIKLLTILGIFCMGAPFKLKTFPQF